jgi:hypothetical protein
MTKEMYVSSTPHETKIALVEDDQLSEIFFERENEYTLAGSIYKGRVTRVLPGMQSAFVDIGLERDAFLYVSDFLELPEDEESEFEEIAVSRPETFVTNRPAPEAPRFEFVSDAGGPAAADEPELDESENEDATEGNTQEFAELDMASTESQEGEAEDRFRGNRRRRRGRRGRGFPETKFARPRPASEAEPAATEQEYGPPAGYEPVILPGESLSKYRRAETVTPTQQTAPEQAETRPSQQPSAGATDSESTSEPSERVSPETAARASSESGAERPPTAMSERTSSPMLLPGESIAKYQPRDPGEASGPSSSEAPRESAPPYRDRNDRRPRREDRFERRPRTEREPQEYLPEGAGLTMLPGESISKYRNRPAGELQPKPSEAQPVEAVELNDPHNAANEEARHAQQAATFVIESEPWAETLAEELDEESRSASYSQPPSVARFERQQSPAESGSESATGFQPMVEPATSEPAAA